MECQVVGVISCMFLIDTEVGGYETMDMDLVHLINAVRMNHRPSIEQCLLKGADINGADHATGMSPLHFAVLYRAIDVIPLLLAAGADVEAQDFLDDSPLNLADKYQDQTIQNLLSCALKAQMQTCTSVWTSQSRNIS